jgi:peptide-methionine (S)-S-oxide reductase
MFSRNTAFSGAMPRLRERQRLLHAVAWLSLTGLVLGTPAVGAERPTVIPRPATDAAPAGNGSSSAVLAGGCFWGMQAVFEHVKGVRRVVSGYSGGSKESADYETVSTGRTGHAESIEITFDPHEISYGRILQVYFSVAHNPTELNRQGPDSGPQYRSEIFYADEMQKHVAEGYIAQLDRAGVFEGPIVTKVDRLAAFYPAETYHQDYAILHPDSPYIAYNDLPKVANLKRLFPDAYRESPVTVIAAGTTTK